MTHQGKERNGVTDFRTRRPAVNAAVCWVAAVASLVLAAAWIWVATTEPPLSGPAVAHLALAAIGAAIAVAARRFAVGPTTAPNPRTFQALTIAAFLTGFADAALGIVSGAVGSSVRAIAAGIIVFVLGAGVALQGALLYGAAAGRASAQQPRPRA